MKVILTKKMSDDWSRTDIYQGCKHRIGSYYKRSGAIYTGDFNPIDRERFEKTLGNNLSEKIGVELNPFWVNYHVMLDGKNKNVYDTSDIKDEFDVKFLENHKDVAIGYTDRKPGTKYVLIKEQDEAEVVNKKAQIKVRAFTEYGRLTPEQMRKALRLYGHNPNSVSNEIVQSSLYTLVEEDPGKFITIWVDNPNKDIQFLIEESVAKNIIRNNKTIYKYGSDVIGYTLEETIDYLKDPRNGNIRLAIISQLEGKKEIDAPIEERGVKSQYKKLLEEIEKDNDTVKESAPEEKVEETVTPSKKKSKE